jgi:hypothetical protein
MTRNGSKKVNKCNTAKNFFLDGAYVEHNNNVFHCKWHVASITDRSQLPSKEVAMSKVCVCVCPKRNR